MGISKWIGGILGGLWGGPVGALVGFGVGSFFDKAMTSTTIDEDELFPHRVGAQYRSAPPPRRAAQTPRPAPAGQNQTDEFTICVCVLIAGVMKSDGALQAEELRLVEQRLRENYHFSPDGTRRMLGFIQELAQGNWNVEEFALRARRHLHMPARRNLLFFLLEIACANGQYVIAEQRVIHSIATIFDIRPGEVKAMEAVLNRTGDEWAYQALEIRRDATDGEVKKAYRRLAMMHHPDRVAGQGEVAEAAATRKFQAINAAYETIKKERGFS
ncbi:MAG: TerB family tellurite resistance protein [Victivallales bacterium]|nr:TerB family tellurite resistance protein [Victivallales bacterium]